MRTPSVLTLSGVLLRFGKNLTGREMAAHLPILHTLRLTDALRRLLEWFDHLKF